MVLKVVPFREQSVMSDSLRYWRLSHSVNSQSWQIHYGTEGCSIQWTVTHVRFTKVLKVVLFSEQSVMSDSLWYWRLSHSENSQQYQIHLGTEGCPIQWTVSHVKFTKVLKVVPFTEQSVMSDSLLSWRLSHSVNSHVIFTPVLKVVLFNDQSVMSDSMEYCRLSH